MADRANSRKRDRVGLGWRGELAAGILAHVERIDFLEIIAEDHFRATDRQLRSLVTLSSQLPISLHGVSMGLASTESVESWRMDRMARLVDRLQPESWSEHLAFVRSGGVEIGHLAAPPHTEENIEAAIGNIARAAAVVGGKPAMENIATLIDPPGSRTGEAQWVSAIVEGSGASLLVDLHNLYANACNFGQEPADLLRAFPLARVTEVHLSGGIWVEEPGSGGGRQRLLDDHLHDVPAPVFALLELLGEQVAGPLDVIIERDGAYPAFASMLAEVDAARAALARGRARAVPASMPLRVAA